MSIKGGRVKRYRDEVKVYWTETKVEMIESPDGKWVKHEDILKEMQKLSKRAFDDGVNSAQGDVKKQLGEAYHDGYFTGYNSRVLKCKYHDADYEDWGSEFVCKIPTARCVAYRSTSLQPGIKMPECNCHKYVTEKNGNMYFYQSHGWICPAHGYKRR